MLVITRGYAGILMEATSGLPAVDHSRSMLKGKKSQATAEIRCFLPMIAVEVLDWI